MTLSSLFKSLFGSKPATETSADKNAAQDDKCACGKSEKDGCCQNEGQVETCCGGNCGCAEEEGEKVEQGQPQ